MPADALRLALGRLADFSSPPPGTRDRLEPTDRLLGLAAGFARELHVGGRRLLTARRCRFDRAMERTDTERDAVKQALEKAGQGGLHVEDETGHSSADEIECGENSHGLYFSRVVRWPNALPAILARLDDKWAVVWDRSGVYRDTERLLAADLGPARRAVETWQDAVRQFVADDEAGRLIGCFLLDQCLRCVGPKKAGEVLLPDLVPRLMKDPAKFARIMASAAESLATAEAPPASPATTPPWFHASDDDRPPEFNCGPLAGAPQVLTKIICPEFADSRGNRALQNMGRDGRVWIVKHTTKCLEVYFKPGPQFETCAKEYESILEKRKAAASKKVTRKRRK